MVVMELSEGCCKRERAKYFRSFWGLPENEVGIIFLEEEHKVLIQRKYLFLVFNCFIQCSHLLLILFSLSKLSIYRYMDYKREVVCKREVFKLGNFSQEWKYYTTIRRQIKLGNNFVSQRTTIMFCISYFTIPFTTHCLKIIKAKFENLLDYLTFVFYC